MALVKLEDVIDLLVEEGYLTNHTTMPPIKPGHGPCCTCQDCGYYHDDCVCYNNELHEKLAGLVQTKVCPEWDDVDHVCLK